VSGGWDISVVDDSFNSVGLYTSLAVGPLGQPQISYQDGTGFDLLYASGPQELLAVNDPPRALPTHEIAASPNPSRLGSSVRFLAQGREFDRVRLFDVAGRFERELPLGDAGLAEWDGRTAGGELVAPGVHLVRPVRADGSSGHATRVIIVH